MSLDARGRKKCMILRGFGSFFSTPFLGSGSSNLTRIWYGVGVIKALAQRDDESRCAGCSHSKPNPPQSRTQMTQMEAQINADQIETCVICAYLVAPKGRATCYFNWCERGALVLAASGEHLIRLSDAKTDA